MESTAKQLNGFSQNTKPQNPLIIAIKPTAKVTSIQRRQEYVVQALFGTSCCNSPVQP